MLTTFEDAYNFHEAAEIRNVVEPGLNIGLVDDEWVELEYDEGNNILGPVAQEERLVRMWQGHHIEEADRR